MVDIHKSTSEGRVKPLGCLHATMQLTIVNCIVAVSDMGASGLPGLAGLQLFTIERKYPAARALPITPATFGPMACMSR